MDAASELLDGSPRLTLDPAAHGLAPLPPRDVLASHHHDSGVALELSIEQMEREVSSPLPELRKFLEMMEGWIQLELRGH